MQWRYGAARPGPIGPAQAADSRLRATAAADSLPEPRQYPLSPRHPDRGAQEGRPADSPRGSALSRARALLRRQGRGRRLWRQLSLPGSCPLPLLDRESAAPGPSPWQHDSGNEALLRGTAGTGGWQRAPTPLQCQRRGRRAKEHEGGAARPAAAGTPGAQRAAVACLRSAHCQQGAGMASAWHRQPWVTRGLSRRAGSLPSPGWSPFRGLRRRAGSRPSPCWSPIRGSSQRADW